jgi:hypothetical protein
MRILLFKELYECYQLIEKNSTYIATITIATMEILVPLTHLTVLLLL